MKKWKAVLAGAVILAAALPGTARAENPGMEKRRTETAVFAGGCFWCTQSLFDNVDGVLSTAAGYTGGHKPNPTYQEVSSGTTGHAEALQILFDPSKISYEELLDIFLKNIDPTAVNQQFNDAGTQYRTAVFYQDGSQKELAEAAKKRLEQSGRFDKPIVTEIVPASEFYPAEDYHQQYYKKNPVSYKFYTYMSGRDRFLEEKWGAEKNKGAGQGQ